MKISRLSSATANAINSTTSSTSITVSLSVREASLSRYDLWTHTHTQTSTAENSAAASVCLHKTEGGKKINIDWLEGVDPRVPAQQLQQFVVETEGKGDTQSPEADVWDNSDDAELENTGQADHQPREDQAGRPCAPPVHQIHDWQGDQKERKDKNQLFLTIF